MNCRSSAEGQNNILSIVSAVTMICFRFCNDANFTIGNKYLNTGYNKILALHVIDGGM